MKTIKITGIVSAFLVLMIQACKLTDVTDLKPPYKLDESTVVTDIPSAEKLLAGTYYSLRDEKMSNQIPLFTSLMGVNVVSTVSGGFAYSSNAVQPSDLDLNNYLYAGPYQLIQTANWVIDKTNALSINTPRKWEIIAEAKFLRALGHFYALRLFGEFWDLNSKFGIELKKKPNNPLEARASVKESYDFILADLDDAILGCPEYKTGVRKGYATKLGAKAIKSRVLLYQKDFTGAALLAKEVLAGPAKLTNNFGDMFRVDKYNSDEVILASIIFAVNNDLFAQNGKLLNWGYSGFLLSDRYAALMADDKRSETIEQNYLDPDDPKEWRGNGKFMTGVNESGYDTEYYFRLAEAYLIYAEAEARRPGGNLNDAIGMLNALRVKRGMTGVSASDKATLLSLIRREKELELGAESGEDWYDIVRYIKNGDVKATAIKNTLADERKLILPIPQVTVDASNKLISQNPGY